MALNACKINPVSCKRSLPRYSQSFATSDSSNVTFLNFYKMDNYQSVFTLWVVVFILTSSVKVNGQTYTNGLTIFNDVLDSSRYNPNLRPLVNQSASMQVNVTFQLLSIVELDDVRQSLTCNGFLTFAWRDEVSYLKKIAKLSLFYSRLV